jgi:Flp pilus assembly protein TadD
MGLLKPVVLGLLTGLLAACAQLPQRDAALPAGLWRDEAFAYDASLVRVDKAQLFQLDAGLLAELHSPALQSANVEQRMTQLVTLVLEDSRHPFVYSTGASTTAAQTWAAKRGDCLSLTVLAYAMARELRLPAQMQEVPVPVLFDRRGDLDYLAGHVNVFVKGQPGADKFNPDLLARGTVIDFELQVGVAREGRSLSDEAILARYYNNLGVSLMAEGRAREAYAHFKAAVQADAQYASTFSNLALLYHSKGLDAQAEQLLRHAGALADDSGAALRALQRLLLAQGRQDEAAALAAALQAKQEKDPYYWIGLGLDRLQRADYRGAIAALERAQKMAQGFAEVHHYLAVAYARDGRPADAQRQLALLMALNSDDPYLLPLASKISRIQAGRM